VPEEQALRREDVLALIEAMAGIRADLQEVVGLLKRKRRTVSREERAARDALAEEQVRRLRELVAKGEAELEAKRAAEASGQ